MAIIIFATFSLHRFDVKCAATMSDITQLIEQIEAGNQRASEELLPLVYGELRRLAQARIANVAPGQTLQATALVHEAFIRLVDAKNTQEWDSQGHFFAAAAEAMRRIMVENARRKGRVKHGGAFQKVDISVANIAETQGVSIESLDAALSKFEAHYPEQAKLIKLRFFAGLSEKEAAAALGISRATASRQWTFGRTWLFKEMKP